MNRISPSQPILIIGKTNSLGQAFARICEERNLNYLLLGREEFDITNRKNANDVLADIRPWAVINTVGYNDIDGAEKDESLCQLLNTNAPAILATLCKQYRARFVHFSSDQVFSGTKSSPYTELDTPAPINVYGRSKHEGELAIQERNAEALIIRTGNLFSPWSTNNFVYQVLQSLQNEQLFTSANDITISPTYTPDLVNHTLDHLFDSTTGILHLTSSGKTTWAEFAMQIAVKAGYPASLIEPVSAHSHHMPAKRPAYSVLSSIRGAKLPYYQDALHRYFAALHIEEHVLTGYAA